MISNMIKVKKIVISLKEGELKLSLDEAKELYNELGKIFAERVIWNPITIPSPQPLYPSYPWNPPFITTSDGTTSKILKGSNDSTVISTFGSNNNGITSLSNEDIANQAKVFDTNGRQINLK